MSERSDKCDHTFHRLGGIDDCPICSPLGDFAKPSPAEPSAREFWLKKFGNFWSSCDPDHEAIKVIEFSAFERLKTERDSYYHDFRMKFDIETKKLQAALEAKEAEILRYDRMLLDRVNQLEALEDKYDQVRAELAEANKNYQIAWGLADSRGEQLTAAREREAKMIEALEKIANHKQNSVDKVYLIHQCEGYQTVAREALAEIKESK